MVSPVRNTYVLGVTEKVKVELVVFKFNPVPFARSRSPLSVLIELTTSTTEPLAVTLRGGIMKYR